MAGEVFLAPPTQGATVPGDLSLPLLESTFPRHRHPFWSRLRETSRAWMDEQRIMPPEMIHRYAGGLRYTDLVAGYYIGAPAPVLSAIADFSIWFFAWDDRHDRDVLHRRDAAWGRLCGALHAALDAPQAHKRHPDPLVAAFADCVDRMFAALGSSTWNARFAGHFHPVVDAYDQEYRNRLTGNVPTVDEYLELRRLTFAHWIWIDLLEAAGQCELPAWVRDSDAYCRAGLATQDFSAWYNDLCSLPKELARGELHNLGISLIRHEGLSQEQAAVEVRHRVEECITDYLEAEEEVMCLIQGAWEEREVQRAVNSCLGNMRNWFSSVYWFHHESSRYQVHTWDDPSAPPYVSDPAVNDEH